MSILIEDLSKICFNLDYVIHIYFTLYQVFQVLKAHIWCVLKLDCEHVKKRNIKIHNGMLLLGQAYHIYSAFTNLGNIFWSPM